MPDHGRGLFSRPPISGLSVVNLQIPETFMSACYPREKPDQQQFAAIPSAIYGSIVYNIYYLVSSRSMRPPKTRNIVEYLGRERNIEERPGGSTHIKCSLAKPGQSLPPRALVGSTWFDLDL